MAKSARIKFGTPRANQIAKRDKEHEVSRKYLENLPELTESEKWLLQKYDELEDAENEVSWAKSAKMSAAEAVERCKLTVLEERQHETRTSE